MMIHARQLQRRHVSPRFRTKAELRQAFTKWNRAWKHGFSMRIVSIHNGGYAGVIRIRKVGAR